ncbi:MAG: DUF1800 domain-containing protein, partial [Acidimicrobiales bacterium]
MTDTRSDIAHLYRRAGFGALPSELDAAEAQGYQAAVAFLLHPPSPTGSPTGPPDPTFAAAFPPPRSARSRASSQAERLALAHQLAQDRLALGTWWMDRMTSGSDPLAEKMTLYWHGHFATSIQKVRYPVLMFHQNQIFRSMGLGSFATLTQTVAKNPAMLIWLDAGSDHISHPNENFSRELMELFTLGLGNYTEDDVRQAARCFTGWQIDRSTGGFTLPPAQHDNGTKTFLGHTANLSGEDVISIVTQAPAGQRFVAARMWSHFAYPITPTDKIVDDLIGAYGANLDLSALMQAVFTHPQFLSDQARSGLIKQPVEWVVGAQRALRTTLGIPATEATLAALGQVPFAPPNVGGWPQNGYWLSTSASST